MFVCAELCHRGRWPEGMFLGVTALMHFTCWNNARVKQNLVWGRGFGNAILTWHISERTIFKGRMWKVCGAAAEPMSDWGWSIQLEILAGLMEFVMEDWIRTGIQNKPAWDYLLEDLELTCGVTFSFLWSTGCWSDLSHWAGDLAQRGGDVSKAQGPCREELMCRILQCSVTACRNCCLLAATEAFQAPAWCCMGDDSPSCTGLSSA